MFSYVLIVFIITLSAANPHTITWQHAHTSETLYLKKQQLFGQFLHQRYLISAAYSSDCTVPLIQFPLSFFLCHSFTAQVITVFPAF